MSDALDRLYRELAGAHHAEEQLARDDEKVLAQIESRERELQDQRAETESAGDTRQLQAIDDELRELAEAYHTIKDRQA